MAKDKGKTGISLFTNATADKVLKYAKVTPVSSSSSSQTVSNRPTNVPKPGKVLTARVVEEIKTEDVGYGYYKMQQVRRDKGETPDLDVWTDVGMEFTGFELGETTGIKVDKVFTCRYVTGLGGAVWTFRQGGGGSGIITLRINTKINGTNYGCDIVDNRRDKNITTPYDPNKKNILWLDNEPAWDLQTGDYYSAVLIGGEDGNTNTTYQTVGSIFLRN